MPLAPELVLNNIIFYLRFLDSLNHTWWIEQILDTDQTLSDSRIDPTKLHRKLRASANQVAVLRRQHRLADAALTALPSPSPPSFSLLDRLNPT